jgi:hypothetical protein
LCRRVQSVTASPEPSLPSTALAETEDRETWPEAERAAIVEHGGGIPRAWPFSDARPAAPDPPDPAFWRNLFEERAAIRESLYGRAAAARLAWGSLQNRWHLALGERVPPDRCAGCRRPIGGAEALDLIDGNRVHDVAGHDCLIRHGERWRSAATLALVAMGLRPPGEGAP